MKFVNSILLATVAAVGVASAAQADTTAVYTSNVITNATTDYSSSLTFAKFDPTLGTLQSVFLTLYGTVQGNIRFESLDAAPNAITTNLGATLSLLRPDNSTIVVSLPVYSATTSVSAFDGTIDFGGTSGRTFTGVNASNNNSVTLTSGTDLSLFTGPGSLSASFTATGNSTATGAGNLVTQFNTTAGGYAQVQYTYAAAAVPEPASWAMMVGGFGMIGGALRRRKVSAVTFA